ncbi:hypothetical protein [Streptomyces sp. NPDC056160]|uniref:hypothetical protein n=1 Tax=Streptomyces sp. NPDC056160 TaxID=3345731 RepID=UPI0035DE7068
MDQATQATPLSADRAAYQHAKTAADQLVDRMQALPDTVETRRELGSVGVYGIRLHFGTGLAAGRGVLEVAGIADAEVTRDTARDGVTTWIELHTVLDGIPLIARALTTRADADQLLHHTDTSAPTPPIPTDGTSPAALMPDVIAVANAAASGAML